MELFAWTVIEPHWADPLGYWLGRLYWLIHNRFRNDKIDPIELKDLLPDLDADPFDIDNEAIGRKLGNMKDQQREAREPGAKRARVDPRELG